MTFSYSLLVAEVPRGIFPLMPLSSHAKMYPFPPMLVIPWQAFIFVCVCPQLSATDSSSEPPLFSLVIHLIKFLTSYLCQSVKENDPLLKV